MCREITQAGVRDDSSDWKRGKGTKDPGSCSGLLTFHANQTLRELDAKPCSKIEIKRVLNPNRTSGDRIHDTVEALAASSVRPCLVVVLSLLVLACDQGPWFERVEAELGDAGAQYRLGFMYGKGQGVPQDYAQAVNWFRKAAEQGFPKAIAALYDLERRAPLLQELRKTHRPLAQPSP